MGEFLLSLVLGLIVLSPIYAFPLFMSIDCVQGGRKIALPLKVILTLCGVLLAIITFYMWRAFMEPSEYNYSVSLEKVYIQTIDKQADKAYPWDLEDNMTIDTIVEVDGEKYHREAKVEFSYNSGVTPWNYDDFSMRYFDDPYNLLRVTLKRTYPETTSAE